jgi:oxygen-independent coproporphyrinogen-3 oxidase
MRGRSEPPFLGARVKTIFFGGGTPSLFAPGSIANLIEAADQYFGIERDAEITLEANPGAVDQSKLAAFRLAGVNRISFGAQSFNLATLKFLGRRHSAEATREAARAAYRAGFERLNLDLIFAVPGQSVADVRYDVEQAAALEPDHISAYNLTFEEGTVFFAEMKHGRIRPLDNDEQAAMYALVREEIPRRGYPMYEISNYARPGHESRHNLSYWRAESYLGLGAGAHSYGRVEAGGRRWWNERAPQRYIELAARNGLAEAGAETIDHATAMSEYAILNLRLREGLRLAEFENRFGQSFNDQFGEIVRRLIEGGMLSQNRESIRLTDRGIEVADSIFTEFV